MTGDDEYDELVLTDEVYTLVRAIISDNLDNKLTEASLLKADAYGKIVVCLEEMLRDGHLFHKNLETVMKMAKLKKLGPA